MLPTYEDMILPILQLISTKREMNRAEIVQNLKEKFAADPNFKTTEEEFNELVPSGFNTKFKLRISWAVTYLYKAGLINKQKPGVYKITERGINVLNEKPQRIDTKFLRRFEEFVNFLDNREPTEPVNLSITPEEQLEQAYKSYKDSVVKNLHEMLRLVEPDVFEQIVLDVLVRMGYGGNREEAAQVVGKPGDEGIDGVIKQDPLGLDNVYVQAKRWQGTVGRPEIQGFVGALQGKGATKGVFITSGNFSEEAKRYVLGLGNVKVVLIDGQKLAELMYKYNVGVSTHAVFEIKKIDNDYFQNMEGF